jgi:hypothetical protein
LFPFVVSGFGWDLSLIALTSSSVEWDCCLESGAGYCRVSHLDEDG